MKNVVLSHTKYLAIAFIFLFTLNREHSSDSRLSLPDQVQIESSNLVFSALLLLGSQKYIVIAGKQLKASKNS